MHFKTTDIWRLIQELAEKTGTGLDHYSFRQMYETIEMELDGLPFRESYLYKAIFCQLRKAEEEKIAEISLNANYVHALVRFLSYTNYEQFLELQYQPVSVLLQKCIGTWFSFVRCNSGNPDIFIAPVKIYANGRAIHMQLKGQSRTYNGRMTAEGNNLYCLLESGEVKRLHLVFRIGLEPHPELLQGVFSGISSAGDPIAGRELLIRQQEDFDKLKNRKVAIKKMLASADEQEMLIAKYFQKQERNIISAGKSSSFSKSDLITGL